MNSLPFTPPKHWVLRALLILAWVAASCSVPNFEVAGDDGGLGAPHCNNLISDQGETGLDCGGTCPACPAGGSCLVNNDCAGNQCVQGVCQDASCTDGVQSGSETAVDCGGGACSPCASGSNCLAGRDCASGVCLTGACAQPSCSDTIQNGDESDADCGGSCPACLPGQRCKLPTDCAGGDCTNGSCSLTCLDGKGNCDGDAANGCETNLKTDTDHCGACDTPCNLMQATARCTGGACQVDTCTAPFADCDGDPKNGCETNTSTDAGNCSVCGKLCPAVNGTANCVDSACQITCDDTHSDCDGEVSNGCETSIASDTDNCGKCGNVCPTSGGSANCKAGKCGVTNCAVGLGDCDADGVICEVNTTNDVNNCGKCGKPCVVAHGTPSCVNSVCTVASCDAGYANCTGGYADGCETNIISDQNNCGTCGKVCTIANGTAKCDSKVCKVFSCTPPFDDCDKNGTDCETNLSTSTGNCGGCGTAGVNCATDFANGTGKCLASSCQLQGCSANFGDCNGLENDGCEANLKTDANNCGVCNTLCQAPHGSNSCNGGTCLPNCGTAFGDCDGNVKTGCEAVFASDTNNCGSCNTACLQTNATNTCVNSACNPVCSQSFFKSCDSNDINGCESDNRSDRNNCGGCGTVCVVNAATTANNCSGSTCIPTCATNHANCDGDPANGCEATTTTDLNHCGNCTTHCLTQNAASSSCSSGTCAPVCNSGFAACAAPAAGCLTSIDTAAHCGNCTTACSGASPFCVSRACATHLAIGVVNATTIGNTTATAQTLVLAHTLQTSATANAYRFLVVGVSGFGNGQAGSEPVSVQYNGIDMTVAKQTFSGNQVSTSIYYLQGANLPPNAGTYNLVVAPSGNNSFVLTANVVELINVEQSTGGLDHVGGTGTGNSCTSHTPSDPVTVSFAGDYIYSLAGAYDALNDATPAATGQTITEKTTFGSLHTYAGYLAAPATGARTITWTIGMCSASAHALLSIKPAVTP